MRNGRLLGGLAAASILLSLLATGALGQSSSSGDVSSSAEVANEAPSNLRVGFGNTDQDPATPGVQVSPIPGGRAKVTVVGEAEDGNGWKDLRKGEVQVFRPDGTPYTAVIDAAPADEGRGKRREFTAIFDLGPNDPAGEYVIRFVAKDHKEMKAMSEGSFFYLEMIALSLDSGALNLGAGALGPGASTHASPAAVRVSNAGNVKLDIRISATGLKNAAGDATIGPDRLKYSSEADMKNERALSTGGIVDDKFDLAPGLARSAYFDLHMPTGEEQYIPAARYAGSITIGGVVG